MQATNGNSTLALGGVNQQDFKALQLVSGVFPAQYGLQQRFPGKSLQQTFGNPVGSIYVFYMVYGRTFTLIDFGILQIEEVVTPPIKIPALPPSRFSWFDSFGSYPVDTISKLWGGGAWFDGIGVCETIIESYIDPFMVVTVDRTPIDVPVAGPSTEGTPGPTGGSEGPAAVYPPGAETYDLVLRVVFTPQDAPYWQYHFGSDDSAAFYDHEPPNETFYTLLLGRTIPHRKPPYVGGQLNELHVAQEITEVLGVRVLRVDVYSGNEGGPWGGDPVIVTTIPVYFTDY